MNPQNRNAVIIGVGQIGGSLGLALRKANFFFKIFGCDVNIQRLKLAKNIFDSCFDNLMEAIDKSDVVMFASPINELVKSLKFGFENFPDKLYTDVGSTKVPMLELSKKYDNVRYIGGHPLAGSEKKGEFGWDASLFKGKPYFYTFDENQTSEDKQFFVEMIKSIGANPISFSAAKHDRMVAMTSHVPLLLSLAMMSAFSEGEEQLAPFVGSGFQSITRLAGGSPEMGKDLLISNRENILIALKDFSEKLLELSEHIKNKDDVTFYKKMKSLQDLYWKVVEKSK